ncbi:MAG: hypothetical protein WC505_06800 [Patescibacteria group bacterium]
MLRNKEVTLDLTQAAAPTTYDALTATGDVMIMGINAYVQTAGGGDLTSVSIQTNQTTPLVLLTAGQGAVANLLAQSHPTSTMQTLVAPWTLRSGQKVQYTLTAAGGAHTGSMRLFCSYMPISPGATL